VTDPASFLADRYGPRAGPPEPLGAGEWSRAYAFTLDGRDMVIRFGAHGEDFAKDARMARHSTGRLPIPAVLDVGPTGDGRYYAISERAQGDYLDQLDGPGMRLALPAVLDALSAVRHIDLSGTTGYGLWRPDGNAPHERWTEALLDVLVDRPGRRVSGWRAALARSPDGLAAFEAGTALLRELAPRCPQPRRLVHGDLLYRNVLVHADRLTAVLDWGNSLYGDPLYDLAWLLYWWTWYPDWRDIDIHAAVDAHLDTVGEPRSGRDTRLHCYQLHIGLEHLAYNAFTGRRDDLARNARQTMDLVHAR
jgi:hygromycin-B 4-O-kinase